MQNNVWRGLADFCLAVARRFAEERCVQTAGSLTYTTLLALVPLATVALAVATAFPVFDQIIGALQDFMVENFLPDARGIDTIAEQINVFTRNVGRLTAIGLIFLAVTAVMLMLTVDEAMNRIFRVPRRRALLQRAMTYWAVLTLGPVLIGGSLSATSFAIAQSFGGLNLDIIADAILRVLPFIFTCAALTLLYAVVPNRRVEWRHALVGGILAGVVFELAKRGFALWLSSFGTYALIYGAFAAIPIFLLWLYLSWLVVLAGATFTAILPGYRGVAAERDRSPGRDLAEALAVLEVLVQAQDQGRVVSLTHIASRVRLLPYRVEQILERAARMGWTARTEREGWVLARDAATIKVADLYRGFVFDAEAVGVHDSDLELSLRQYSDKEQKGWQALHAPSG